MREKEIDPGPFDSPLDDVQRNVVEMDAWAAGHTPLYQIKSTMAPLIPIGVQGATGFLEGKAEPVQVGVVVLFGEEARLAAVAALDDVQRNVVEMDAWPAGHTAIVSN